MGAESITGPRASAALSEENGREWCKTFTDWAVGFRKAMLRGGAGTELLVPWLKPSL